MCITPPYSQVLKPSFDTLIPPSCDKAPDGYWYPTSHHWNLKHDRHFSSGWVYVQPFDSSKKQIYHDRMLHVKTHPDATPIQSDGVNWMP